jgi:hypothetical protein
MNAQLLEKLVVAKKIMDKSNDIQRGSVGGNIRTTVESYEPVNASYNIPQEFLAEQPKPKQVPNNMNSKERILSSKLPDEIKKLMIEHPIEQPRTSGTETILSDELVEAASRLMKTDASGKQVRQTVQRQPQGQNVSESVLDISNLRSMLKDVVKEVLSEQGVITESTQKTKEQITFRVGQHVFEGVITKIKKVK